MSVSYILPYCVCTKYKIYNMYIVCVYCIDICINMYFMYDQDDVFGWTKKHLIIALVVVALS